MKKHLLLICTLLCSAGIFAQQEPLYSQYKTNMYVLNPAIAGTQNANELRLNYRSQWQRFPGAPRTATMSYHGTVDEKNALGAMVFRDAVGPTTRSGIQLSYAYRMPLGYGGSYGQNMLSFGIGAKYLQYGFQGNEVYFVDPNDPAKFEAAQGLRGGDLAFGAYYYNDVFYLGFSAPNLIQSDLGTNLTGMSSPSLLGKLYRHYFLVGGYRFEYDEMVIEPSVLIKKVQTSPFQVEGTVRFLMVDEKLMLGASYRTDWLGTLMFGLNTNNLHFVYSADFMMRQPATPATVFGTSHEFTVGIDLGSYWKRFYTE